MLTEFIFVYAVNIQVALAANPEELFEYVCLYFVNTSYCDSLYLSEDRLCIARLNYQPNQLCFIYERAIGDNFSQVSSTSPQWALEGQIQETYSTHPFSAFTVGLLKLGI